MTHFNKEDLKKLSSKSALSMLLMQDKPDFAKVLDTINYEKEMIQLQAKMIKLQNLVVENRERVIIIFEGREFSGKGGAIRSLIDHLNPRSLRVVALPKPTKREEELWYFQRYVMELPEGGEMVFFDRSWYNRAMVEPVNGFCTHDEYKRFMSEVRHFEEMLVNDGIILLKIYLTISKKVQGNRISRIHKNPLRRWELTPVDLKAQQLWETYNKYEKEMLKHTDVKHARWKIIDGNVSIQARLNCIKFIIKELTSKL